MNDDIVPISYIPLLESQSSKNTVEHANNYFYLYYQTTSSAQKPSNEDAIIKMEEENALPRGWENMQYEEFLLKRRTLMAAKIKRAFEKL